MRIRLPVDEAIPELVNAVSAGRNVVLHAPTGAGKTTRVPVAVSDAMPGKRVIMLEPRRLAAVAAAARMADEDNSPLGGRIGYQVRQDRKHGADTEVLVVTEGILVRMLQDDPFLDGVGAVIFDEFHERSIHTDLGLALARQCQREVRPDLRLIVMSATLDSDSIAGWLDAQVVRSEGRSYPVEQHWESMDTGWRALPQSVSTGVRRALQEAEGHTLVFLPGMGEIRRCEQALASWVENQADVLILHGSMPLADQQRTVAPSTGRRIILSTNIAETSLTVPGVGAVVDVGLERRLMFDISRGMDILDTVNISLAAATQRSGRAGRERPGWALRLWHPSAEHRMAAHTPPEIERVDLCYAVTQVLAWGATDPLHGFDWFEQPPEAAASQALETLRVLGLRDSTGQLNAFGRALSSLPLHPRLARVLASCAAEGHAETGAMAAAMLSERDIVSNSALRVGVDSVGKSSSDVWDRVSVLLGRPDGRFRASDLMQNEAARVRQSARQLRAMVTASSPFLLKSDARGHRANAEDALARGLMRGWPDRIGAGTDTGRVTLIDGAGARPAPQSAVRDEELVVCVEFDTQLSGGDRLYRMASALQPDWIDASLRAEETDVLWDAANERVIARRQTRLGSILLRSQPVPLPDDGRVEELLASQVVRNSERALGLDLDGRRSLHERIECARLHEDGSDWPKLDALSSRLAELCHGCRSFADLRKRNLLASMVNQLPWAQQQTLDNGYPSHMEVPSGSHIGIDYADPSNPVLAVRIQELFGLNQTPAIAGGKLPLTLHLLAPNHRPQQVTRDLASFWANTYPDVRRELRQRYPKHAWPEDPLKAAPIRGAKRRPAR
jgi:ATP-dependent helicase HrpB